MPELLEAHVDGYDILGDSTYAVAVRWRTGFTIAFCSFDEAVRIISQP